MKALTTDVVVVGSGSAGISAAFELYQHKRSFVLLERGNKVGGVVAQENLAHMVFLPSIQNNKKKRGSLMDTRRHSMA